jgi:hypothetical protein
MFLLNLGLKSFPLQGIINEISRVPIAAFDGVQLTREIILLRSPATAPEKRLLTWEQTVLVRGG